MFIAAPVATAPVHITQRPSVVPRRSGGKTFGVGFSMPQLALAAAASSILTFKSISQRARTDSPFGDRWLHVAPMMQFTDRHLRCLMRLLSSELILWTEMVKDTTLTFNTKERLVLGRFLDMSDPQSEHPVVLQLGGSDPEVLATAVEISKPWGYDEVNLNCGCPSPKTAKVKNGIGFGAQLMAHPGLVRSCVDAMAAAVSPGVAISVKCRIGTHATMEDHRRDGDSYGTLANFVDTVAAGGAVRRFTVHARSGILSGLSPKENRTKPPLRHDLVRRLARDRPDLQITLNGGICSLTEAHEVHEGGLEAMVGRWAVREPWALADARCTSLGRGWVLQEYMLHCCSELEASRERNLFVLGKPLLNLFNGISGSSAYRMALHDGLAASPEEGGFERFQQAIDKAISLLTPSALKKGKSFPG
eukprot:TRINITY_DN57054_c0_g1_i1.p1 TRINITY_DN57054_c0_g1~~TRINITY_DN57054_c0_g1_i1.p1  ORF type:complete len:419 (+),score=50.94 TRINITY_DN57054_c0_g1_i1:155-1411(+)